MVKITFLAGDDDDYDSSVECSTGCVMCRDDADGLFAEDVEAELDHARTKFPGTQYVLVALMEEVGELAQAMLKREAKKPGWGDEQVWAEAVQVAAMAQRVAVEGDTSFVGNYSEPD